MTVNGIIAEYNPFHNGHAYQLKDAKFKTDADYTIVAMSGNFMQRGTPALLDKFKRTEMALQNGADLVIELPSFFSVSSAEYFATGAVALLDKLGVVDYLCFGSECGDIEILQQIADIFLEEPEEYSALLKQYLKQGMSYPIARSNALTQYCPKFLDYRDVLNSANNILAIEYLKAIKKRQSSIRPVTTLRFTSNYRDPMMGTHQSSALAIRQAVYDNRELSLLADQMPETAFKILEDAMGKNSIMQLNDFSAALHYKLLMEAEQGYTEYLDVSSDLSDRIRKNLCEFTDFRGFCDLLKTKDMTYTRISRCLMHILLNIKADDMSLYMTSDCIQYARVLGFRKEKQDIFSTIKENSSVPILTKLADAKQYLSEFALEILQKELQISSIYGSTMAVKTGISMTNEYRSPLIII